MSTHYSDTQVLDDLQVLEVYVSTRKSVDTDLMVRALADFRGILKRFKMSKPDLRMLYSMFTRLHYVATYIKLQKSTAGRKPNGTSTALKSARRIEGWILLLAGSEFPELSQEPLPEDKNLKGCLAMWHYIVSN